MAPHDAGPADGPGDSVMGTATWTAAARAAETRRADRCSPTPTPPTPALAAHPDTPALRFAVISGVGGGCAPRHSAAQAAGW
jgi:hypothetical protein